MKALALIAFVMMIIALAGAWFAPRFGTATTQWVEEVLLVSGEVLDIHRTDTRGPDEWFRPGRGVSTNRSMTFVHHGRRIHWERGQGFAPVALDLINGEPVVLIPVVGHETCAEFGYPQEGLIAFRFRGGAWQRVEQQPVPRHLRVNLLETPHAIPGWQKGKGQKITVEAKRVLQRESRAEYGASVEQVIRYYSESADSCASIRPQSRPDMDRARRLSAEAETRARTIVAHLASVDLQSRDYSVEEYRSRYVLWGEARGDYAGRCGTVVERTVDVPGGYHLIFKAGEGTGRRVPMSESEARTVFIGIACSSDRVLVMRRREKESLMIHRLDHGGRLIDAFKILLPETGQVSEGRNWGVIWTAVINDRNELSIQLANVRHTQSINMGGIVERSAVYVARLPDESPIQ